MAADGGQGGGVRGRQAEVGPAQGGAVQEQADRLVAAQVLHGGGLPDVGHRERRYAVGLLPRHPQGRMAAGQERHGGTGAQQGLRQAGAGRQQVLAVVEHQQHPLGPQTLRQGLGGRLPGLLPQPQGGGDRPRHQGRVRQRLKLRKPRPVGIVLAHLRGRLQGQPRLAAAAAPGQRDQPVVPEQALDGRKLALPADERGELLGDVAGRSGVVRAAQRGEVGGQVRVAELEHLLRPAEVAQAVLAQVLQGGPGRQDVADELMSRRRDQSLPPVGGGEQPRHAVQGLAEVVAAALLRRPGVQGRPDAQAQAARPLLRPQRRLGGQGRLQGVGGGGVGGAERVPDGLEDDAPARDDALQYLVVAGEGVPHGLGLLLPQAGAALNVGKEEGDGARRQRGRRRVGPRRVGRQRRYLGGW